MFELLSRLEGNMSRVIKSVGNIEHEVYPPSYSQSGLAIIFFIINVTILLCRFWGEGLVLLIIIIVGMLRVLLVS